MSYFKVSLDRYFRLKGEARRLYVELAARLARNKTSSLEVTKKMREEIQKSNFIVDIANPIKTLEREEIIRTTASKREEGWIISPVPQGKTPEEPLPVDKWKPLAISLIVEAGHDPSDNYVSSVVKELEGLGIPIEKAQGLVGFIKKTKVTSVGGWVRTSGKSLIENTINISKHPMYKSYELPKTEAPPATKLEVKEAIKKMKEAVLNAGREQEADD